MCAIECTLRSPLGEARSRTGSPDVVVAVPLAAIGICHAPAESKYFCVLPFSRASAICASGDIVCAAS
eukprot:6518274-Pyramimonas_sp.AAC.1